MTENILLLQGPVGSFFRRLADDLLDAGHTVHKVNLNGGDAFFFRGENVLNYRGTLLHWPQWLRLQIAELGISRIYLFGDCREYHRKARKVAAELGVKVFVFECGYIRPDFITLEENGVNGYSSVPRDAAAFKQLPATPSRHPHPLKHDFLYAAMQAMQYYIAASLSRKQFPCYEHHRPLNVFGEGLLWLKAYAGKIGSKWRDRRQQARLFGKQAKPYFLVPLQVRGDMQVAAHSPFEHVSDFIHDVVASFARHAPADTLLVFKHHPLDRAYGNYARLLQELAEHHHLGDRIVYLHDLYLPRLLGHARGTVTINSTVGLSSLDQKTPVITLGTAVYDIEGLCFQGILDDFWRNPGAVDWELYFHFRAYLMRHNQIKGSLYQKLPESREASGLVWPRRLYSQHINAAGLPQRAPVYLQKSTQRAVRVSP